MNKIQLTYSDIIDILDEHIDESKNFLFVVNHDLAVFISNYLAEEYDIFDIEGSDLDKNYKEYYCSLWFDEDGDNFYCESALGRMEYKETDNFDEPMSYFIFTDMDSYNVKRKLLGDASCTWNYCEFVPDEDDIEEDEECFCPECRKDRFMELIADTLYFIDESDCLSCKTNALMNLLIEFQDSGIEIVKKDNDEVLN